MKNHRMKPHHHVAVWMFAVLAVILAGTLAGDAQRLSAQNNGPSEQTKEFFGEGGEEQFSEPAVCKQEREQMMAKQQEYQQRMEQLSRQMQELQYPQFQQLSQEEYGQLTDEAKAEYDQRKAQYEQQLAEYQRKQEELRAEMEKLQAEMRQMEGNSQPSGECQKAMVQQSIDDMQKFRDKIKPSGAMIAKLDNVLKVLNKLENGAEGKESGVAVLKKAGVDTAELESLIPVVRQDVTNMKAKFSEMVAIMDGFIARADTPEDAFAYMQGQESKFNSAAKVADKLVSDVKKLESVLNKITVQVESLTGGSNGAAN